MASSTEQDVPSSTNSDPHRYYNRPQEHGLQRRNESKILYLRNFNNWIKSTLINEYLKLLISEQSQNKDDIHVFDMGCGKGGDQLKWDIGRVRHVTFSDLAENSVAVCKERYNSRRCCYTAAFFSLDCTTELLRDKLQSTQREFDLVSSQFVLHYAFEKLQSVHRFLRNAAEFLRVGGYFIGTTINSCQLVERCRKSPNQSVSNDVFQITFDSSIDLGTTSNQAIPLFGAKYHFSLDEVVDCPEYLVYFPLLEKLAAQHGLEIADRQTFKDYFDKHKSSSEGHTLLRTMKALERYETSTNGTRGPEIDRNQYKHAEEYIEEANRNQSSSTRFCRTLSQQEWDMTSLYITFAFKKVRAVKYGDDDRELASA